MKGSFAHAETPMSDDANRRTTERRECMLSASYRQAGDEGFYLVALVQDLTPQGASLILPRAVDVNTRLQVKVHVPEREQAVRRELHIKHVAPYGETAWIAGGPFDQELEPAEFESLR
jgi:hypothetical protein